MIINKQKQQNMKKEKRIITNVNKHFIWFRFEKDLIAWNGNEYKSNINKFVSLS